MRHLPGVLLTSPLSKAYGLDAQAGKVGPGALTALKTWSLGIPVRGVTATQMGCPTRSIHSRLGCCCALLPRAMCLTRHFSSSAWQPTWSCCSVGVWRRLLHCPRCAKTDMGAHSAHCVFSKSPSVHKLFAGERFQGCSTGRQTGQPIGISSPAHLADQALVVHVLSVQKVMFVTQRDKIVSSVSIRTICGLRQ